MTLVLPFECPPQLEAALRAAYASPPRAYHDFSHITEVLEHIQSVPHWNDPVAVALAVLFHDAIYEAGRPDNEARSATFALDAIRQHLPHLSVDTARVEQLILLTARHGKLVREDVDLEAALFLDCDMAILASDRERFAAYERAIAQEYCALPPDLFCVGRARFLKGLLAKPHIFLSELFEHRYELRARENLQAALDAVEI